MQAKRKPIDRTAKGAREEVEKRPPRAERLSLQERAFVRAYASDPQSPTFGVGVRSAMKAGYGVDGAAIDDPAYYAANRAAVALLDKPKVRSEIDRIFDSTHLTIADRASVVAEILHQPTKETIHETFNSAGTLTTRQVITSSNASERTRILDIANRMDGLYGKTLETSRLHARALQPMLDHYSRLMRRALQAATEGQGESLGMVDVSEHIPSDTDAVVSISGSESSEVGEVEGEQVSRDQGDAW